MKEKEYQKLLATACETYGLPYGDAELIRVGSNATYALKRKGLVVRVSRKGLNKDVAANRFSFVQRLGKLGFPTIQPHDDYPNLMFDGSQVTFWHYLENKQELMDYEAFGFLLKRFHDIARQGVIPLPVYDPLIKVQKRIQDLKKRVLIEKPHQPLLEQAFETLVDQASGFMCYLGTGIIHGDAHTGNVIWTDKGPVLCDFDAVSIGPREWDLVSLIVQIRRFGLDKNKLHPFWKAYGYNLSNHKYLDFLVRARELSMITWLYQNRGFSYDINKEIDLRMKSLELDDKNASWHAK